MDNISVFLHKSRRLIIAEKNNVFPSGSNIVNCIDIANINIMDKTRSFILENTGYLLVLLKVLCLFNNYEYLVIKGVTNNILSSKIEKHKMWFKTKESDEIFKTYATHISNLRIQFSISPTFHNNHNCL
jgi:hypothetical protein